MHRLASFLFEVAHEAPRLPRRHPHRPGAFLPAVDSDIPGDAMSRPGIDPMHPPAQDMPVVTPESAIDLCGLVLIALAIFAAIGFAAGYFLHR